MTPQQKANELLDQWQSSYEIVTERRLHDLGTIIDDLRSLSSHRNGARIIKANRQQVKNAMRSLCDLWQDLEFNEEQSAVVHLSDLRELRRA